MSFTREDKKNKNFPSMKRPSDEFQIPDCLIQAWQAQPPAEIPLGVIQKIDHKKSNTQLMLQKLGQPIPLNQLIDYQEDAIDAGAFGYVYCAEYQQQKVAVKWMDYHKENKISFSSALNLYVHEVEILKKLNILGMPNILPYVGYYFNEEKEHFALVTRYYPYGALTYYIEDTQSNPPEIRIRMRMVCQLLTDVATLHHHNVTHYDIKTANILVGHKQQLVLIDYGFANQHIFSKWNGTSGYMAPEIFHKKLYSSVADVYSLGVVMWEITQWNDEPYDGLNHAYQRNKLMKSLSDNTPDSARYFIERALALDPFERPTASQIVEGLTIAHPDRLLSSDSYCDEASAMIDPNLIGFKREQVFTFRGCLTVEGEGAGAKCVLTSKKSTEAIFRLKVCDLDILKNKPVFKGSHQDPEPEHLIHTWCTRHVDSALVIYADESVSAFIVRLEQGPATIRECFDNLKSAKLSSLSGVGYFKEVSFCGVLMEHFNSTMQDLYAIDGMDEKINVMYKHRKSAIELFKQGMTLQQLTQMDKASLKEALHLCGYKRPYHGSSHSVFHPVVASSVHEEKESASEVHFKI